ncbi:potassium transporter KefB [Pontibacter sp. H249]|uniref:potassium transporter KefB n=1 Tax=Pontibacter sp. H249 TaxID=3133420 RepID=UPI0030BE022A
MTEQNQLQKPAPLGQNALLGASLVFALVAICLLFGGGPTSDASTFWWLLPLLLVTLAGALGGTFYYLLARLTYKGGWSTAFPNILSALVYILLLAISFALGMSGPN